MMFGTFDREAAYGLVERLVPVASGDCRDVAVMQVSVRRVLWHHLVDVADEDGLVTGTNNEIALGFAARRGRRPISKKNMQAHLGWLRNVGLLTVVAEADIAASGGNTYRLTDHLPEPEVPGPSPAEVAVREAVALAGSWLAEDLADDGLGEEIALWVAGLCDVRDNGPTAFQTASQTRPEVTGLPAAARQHYTQGLLRALTERGWLRSAGGGGEVSPGTRLDRGTRRRRAVPQAVHPLLADRGY